MRNRLLILPLVLALSACSILNSPNPEPTPTPTPRDVPNISTTMSAISKLRAVLPPIANCSR